MKKTDYEKYLDVDNFDEYFGEHDPHEHLFDLSRPENIEFASEILRTYGIYLIKKLAGIEDSDGDPDEL